jgi:hypothetical protein
VGNVETVFEIAENSLFLRCGDTAVGRHRGKNLGRAGVCSLFFLSMFIECTYFGNSGSLASVGALSRVVRLAEPQGSSWGF